MTGKTMGGGVNSMPALSYGFNADCVGFAMKLHPPLPWQREATGGNLVLACFGEVSALNPIQTSMYSFV